jgi:hypothetical protein
MKTTAIRSLYRESNLGPPEHEAEILRHAFTFTLLIVMKLSRLSARVLDNRHNCTEHLVKEEHSHNRA